jgi:hypothetical protein
VLFNIYKSQLDQYLRFLVKNYYEKFQDLESPISSSPESSISSNENTMVGNSKYYIKQRDAKIIPIKCWKVSDAYIKEDDNVEEHGYKDDAFSSASSRDIKLLELANHLINKYLNNMFKELQ